MHGAPMLDAATGHPLVAAPVQQQQVPSQPGAKHCQVQYLAGADMGLYTVQPGAPLQLMAQVPAMLAQQPQQQQQVCIMLISKLVFLSQLFNIIGQNMKHKQHIFPDDGSSASSPATNSTTTTHSD